MADILQSYGTDITENLVTNQNKIAVKVTNNVEFNGVAEIIVTCDWNDRGTLIPVINSVHPTLTGYWLTAINAEELPGSICRATLTYTAQYQTLPATTYVEQTSTQQVDIRLHPNFSDWVSYWDATNEEFPQGTIISGQNFGGVKDFIVGSTTITMTEYFESMPASNHGHIGKLQCPNEAYGTAANWLIVGSTRQQQGYFWIRETVFEFSAIGWNTQIYSTVSG